MVSLEKERTMQQKQDAARISDVSRLANEIQNEYPNRTRTQCLQEAEVLVSRFGIGVTLGKGK